MSIDLIALELKLAFRKPGCPICRLRHRAAERYIRSVLWENVNDGETRMHIVRSLGFCHTHAWQLQQTEARAWQDGLGTGIIYEDLTKRALAGLEAYLHDQERHVARLRAQPNRWRRRLARIGQWWRRSFGRQAKADSGEQWPPGLNPRGQCRVCEISGGSEATYLEWLIRGCRDAEFQEWYCASDGLCLHHLRRALAQAGREHPEAALFLARTARDKLDRLAVELREYIRKHAWEFRHEPKLSEEQSSWIRAVAFFAGDRAEVAERERTAG